MSDNDLLKRLTTLSIGASYLAEVISVNDPDGLARVQIRLLSFDGFGGALGGIFLVFLGTSGGGPFFFCGCCWGCWVGCVSFIAASPPGLLPSRFITVLWISSM